MASPAKEARNKVKVRFPNAIVVDRQPYSITQQIEPDHFVLDAGLGPMHYGPAQEEIDTAWEPAPAPWDFQMVKADYNAFALADFSSGQIIKYVHPYSAESIAFQPQQLQYTNDLDQIQAIANPQAVNAVVQNEDELFWAGAYGPGFDLRWQTQTARLDKRLFIDSFSRFPAAEQYILDGGNPVLRLQFIFAPSRGVDIFVNGLEWDQKPNNRVETSGYIEFRDSVGDLLWTFNLPRSESKVDIEEIIGTFRLRKSGNSLFVEHLIPLTWLQTSSYPLEIDVTIDDQVEASSDDAEQDNGTVTIDAGGILLFNTPEYGGQRFINISGLAGATITAATIDVYVYNASNDFPDEDIHAEDTETPATFAAEDNNITDRTLTTNKVQWNADNQGTGWASTFATPPPDMSVVIQELVDSGYDPSEIAIIFYHTTGDNIAYRSYDGNTSQAPKLHIEYTAAGEVAFVAPVGMHRVTKGVMEGVGRGT